MTHGGGKPPSLLYFVMKVQYNKDFITVYKDVMSPEECDKIIDHYNKVDSQCLVRDRKSTDGAPSYFKDTDTYFVSGTSTSNEIVSNLDVWILRRYKEAVQQCYNHYSEQYGIISSLARHGVSGTLKIQKTVPSTGYHVWHCEHGRIQAGNRLLLAILYLNDVEEGGETEFLYQSLRIKPERGTLIFCPSGFTHTHRGNPPLSGEKYIISNWIEFVE